MVRYGRLALAASLIALVPLEAMAQTNDPYFRMPTSTGIGISFEEEELTLLMSLSSPIPALDFGDAIDVVAAATNGVGAVTYSINSKPSWVNIDPATGRLTGTPPSGSFSFRVRALDSTGAKGSLLVSGVVAPPAEALNIVPNAPLTFKVGRAFSYSVSSPNASGLVTYSAPDRPTWMTVTAQGQITGSPTAPGPIDFDILGFDAIGKSGSYSVSAEVVDSIVLNVAPESAIDFFTVDEDIDVQFASANAVGSVAFSSDDLPDDLTLSSTGRLTGTPSEVGQINATITATDSDGNTGQYDLEAEVVPAVAAFAHNVPASIPTGATVNFTVEFEDGSSNDGEGWSVTGLPAWMSKTNEGDAYVRFGGTVPAGTPNSTLNITVATTDAYGRAASQTFSINVMPFTVASYGNKAGFPKEEFAAPAVTGSTATSWISDVPASLGEVNFNTGVLKIASNATPGVYNGPFTVTVSEAFGGETTTTINRITVNLPVKPVFTATTGASGTQPVSNAQRINGISPINISVTNGEFQICSTATCSTIRRDWSSTTEDRAVAGNFVRLRPLGPITESTTVTLTMDGQVSTWTIAP